MGVCGQNVQVVRQQCCAKSKGLFEARVVLAAAVAAGFDSVGVIATADQIQAQRRDQLEAAIGSDNEMQADNGSVPYLFRGLGKWIQATAQSVNPVPALFLTPLLYSLPVAVLAATIVVAVLSLVSLREIREVWRYSKADFAAMAGTIGVTLLAGVEAGVVTGVGVSLALYLWRASRPHAAIVGRVPGTEHFRNVLRHDVETAPNLLTLRIDESLTFINARWLEEKVLELIAERPELEHLVLMCSAVNAIDASALESLQAINHRLSDAGVKLHLSEVKGPVMDRLKRSDLLEELGGQVFLSQFDAFEELARRASLAVRPGAPAETDKAATIGRTGRTG